MPVAPFDFSSLLPAGLPPAAAKWTGAARYNKAAADLAYGRTLAFFAQHLGSALRQVVQNLRLELF